MPATRSKTARRTRDVSVTFRLTRDELEQIDAHAGGLGLSRTDYLLKTALRQPLGDEGFESQLEAVQGRLDRLERLMFEQ